LACRRAERSAPCAAGIPPATVDAQQLTALNLQTGGLPVEDWRSWLGSVFADLPEAAVRDTVTYKGMLREGILVGDGGMSSDAIG
jgi:hypothetical protein